jgi:hypothetical protein
MSDTHLPHVRPFPQDVVTSAGRLLLTRRGHAKCRPDVRAGSHHGHPARVDLIPPTSPLGTCGDVRRHGRLTTEPCPAHRAVADVDCQSAA